MRGSPEAPPAWRTSPALFQPPSWSFGVPGNGWDGLQESRGAHFLQGSAWARFQAALGHDAVWSSGERWSWLGLVHRVPGFSYLYLPYGPTAADERALADALAVAETAARKLGLDFVRFEPGAAGFAAISAPLERMGCNRAPSVQPERTAVVDLGGDEATLLSAMASGHRGAIGAARRRGVEVTIGDTAASLDAFLDLLHATAKRAGFLAHPDGHFRRMLETLSPLGVIQIGLAAAEDRPAAAALVLDSPNTRFYLHAASDVDLRHTKASVLLVWELMLDAKTRGLRRFDLWGVAPPDAPPSHPWHGFSRFKRGFGAQDLVYAGAWDLPVTPLRYRLYLAGNRTVRRLRRARALL